MARPPDHFRLGVFVLAALALLLVLLFVLGGRSLFEPRVIVETYFNESVSGLEVGSPVKYRGVPMGEVASIGMASTIYQRGVPLDDAKAYIVVRMRLRGVDEVDLRRDLDAYLRRGLRATTQLTGVTGQLFISLDNVPPDKRRDLPFDWTPAYPYIPSAPSLTNQILDNVQGFLATLDKAEVDRLSQSLTRLATTMDQELRQARLGELSRDASATLDELRRLSATLRGTVGGAEARATLRSLAQASAGLERLLADPALASLPADLASAAKRLDTLAADPAWQALPPKLEQAAVQLEAAAARANRMLGTGEHDLQGSLEDLRATLANLREISDRARRDAPGLLLAPPPKPVVLPGATP